jgi:hypothetical protein
VSKKSRPPSAPNPGRFPKGRSGNLKGRPRGTRVAKGSAFEVLLDRTLTLQLAKRGVEGDSAAVRATLAVLEEAGKRQSQSDPFILVVEMVAVGSVTGALEPLRMAKKLDPYGETARMALEPWLVEAALARLPQPLNPADQRTVVNATRTPHKVRWPEWWSEQP